MSSPSTSSSRDNSCHLTWSIPDIVTKITSPNAIQLHTSFPSKSKNSDFKFQLQAIPAYNGHFQIQLVLVQTKQSLNLSHKLSIIGEGGQTGPSEVGKAKCSEKDSNILLAKIMISHDDLTSAHSHLLTNGKLKIFAEVIVLPIEAESHDSTESISTSISIVENLETLLRSGQFSDAVLVVGGQELKVHKSILVRSPLFAAMFQHSDTNQESQISRVEIVDVALDVLESFLLYLYTDKVDSLDRYAWELLPLADKHQLDCLKCVCEQHLSTKLTVESVASTLIIADMYRAMELKADCIKFISENAKMVKDSEGWANIVRFRPDLLALLFDELAMKIDRMHQHMMHYCST